MIKKGLSLEEAFKALNGRMTVKESKQNVKESVVEKVDLDYYDLEEVVKNIKDDLDFNLNIDDIIDYEMDEDGIVTIYLKDKKLIVDEYDNVKIIPEEFDDFPKLTDLAKGEVFTAYFGNHESCDFSYDSKKETLIQKYYDPADTFKYKNIKTQADFEKAVKDDLGDGRITWEKKIQKM